MYTVVCATVALDRKTIRDKVINAPEILAVIRSRSLHAPPFRDPTTPPPFRPVRFPLSSASSLARSLAHAVVCAGASDEPALEKLMNSLYACQYKVRARYRHTAQTCSSHRPNLRFTRARPLLFRGKLSRHGT